MANIIHLNLEKKLGGYKSGGAKSTSRAKVDVRGGGKVGSQGKIKGRVRGRAATPLLHRSRVRKNALTQALSRENPPQEVQNCGGLFEDFQPQDREHDRETSEAFTRVNMRLAFQEALGLGPKEANDLIVSIIDALSQLIAQAPFVKISSFGTFLVHHKAQRLGRNPKTKKEAVISPRKSLSFRSCAQLRTLVNNPS